MKNAYLISAHAYYDQLEKLLTLLDSEENDIFIHINALSEMPEESKLKDRCKYSQIVFSERVPIRWGNSGLLLAELALLEKSIETNNYDYYHMLSVQDLPIKSNTEINRFLYENLYNNKANNLYTNYVNLNLQKMDKRRSYVAQNNYFINMWRLHNSVLRKAFKFLNSIIVALQKIIGIDKFKYENIELCFGQPWWSISEDAAKYILSKKEWIVDHFCHNSFGPDEAAIQTVIYNSKYRDTLFIDADGNYTNLMKLDFIRGNGLGSPYVWRSVDFDELKDSDKLFARKFDSTVDNEIIELITNMITEGEGFYRA